MRIADHTDKNLPPVKITRIESFPIHAPRSRTFTAAQATLTHSDFALVVAETDAGVTGYGEVSSALFYYRLGASHAHDINTHLAPALIGDDPLMIPALVAKMVRVLVTRERLAPTDDPT